MPLAPTEKFDSAVEEYTSALTLLSRVLEAHDRALSELHMLIALALDFVPNATAQAVSHAEKAKDVLLLRLAELEKVAEGERDDKAKREIDDIKGLLGDVDMKVRPFSPSLSLSLCPLTPAPATDRRPPHSPDRPSTYRRRLCARGPPAPVAGRRRPTGRDRQRQ